MRFDHKDFLWCPRHAGTPRQFECTRLITATQVMQIIERIPGFIEQARSRVHAPTPVTEDPGQAREDTFAVSVGNALGGIVLDNSDNKGIA